MRGLPQASEITEQIDLAFEGFPRMLHQLVWMGGGEAGIALPGVWIEVLDRTAT